MYWDKLIIVFLSELISRDDGSTNCQIASHILGNLETVRQSNIDEMARQCHVSTSSISRFCRDIGLNSFAELRDLIDSASFNFDLLPESSSTERRSLDLVERVVESLNLVSESLNHESLDLLVKDIARYQNIALFGLLKAETVAMNLQSDLLVLGKKAVTKVAFKQQLDYLNGATEEDLIVIFSYTGIYFQHAAQPQVLPGKSKPKVYFITSDCSAEPNGYFDHVIRFKSRQDYTSHPFQLQFVVSLIAQSYAYHMAEER